MNFTFESAVYFQKKGKEENCCSQDLDCKKYRLNTHFFFNNWYCVDYVVYRIATYLRQVSIPVMETGLPIDIIMLFSIYLEEFLHMFKTDNHLSLCVFTDTKHPCFHFNIYQSRCKYSTEHWITIFLT